MMKETMNEDISEEVMDKDIEQLLSDENYDHLKTASEVGNKAVDSYIDDMDIADDKKGSLKKIAKITASIFDKEEIESARKQPKEFAKKLLRKTVADLEVEDLDNAIEVGEKMGEGLEEKEVMPSESSEAVTQIKTAGQKVEAALDSFNQHVGRAYFKATEYIFPNVLPLGPLNKPVTRFAQTVQCIAFNHDFFDEENYKKNPESTKLGKGWNPVENFKIGLKFFSKRMKEIFQTKEEKEAALKATKDYLFK